MILEPEELKLIVQIAAYRKKLLETGPSRSGTVRQWNADQSFARFELQRLERLLIEHALQDGITFDGRMVGCVLFTDHAPGSAAYGGTFAISTSEDLSMEAVQKAREEQRRKFEAKAV